MKQQQKNIKGKEIKYRLEKWNRPVITCDVSGCNSV